MKRTIKVALLMCLVLLASALMFTACKDKDVPDSNNEQTTPSETTHEITTPGETTSTEPSPTHVWSEWKTIIEAKCEAEGLLQRYCTECNYTESKPINALGHTPAIIPSVDPTCGQTGLTEGKNCSVCAAILVAQEIIPATGEHNYNSSFVPPTATEDGYTKYSCSCGHFYAEEIIIPTNVTITSENRGVFGYTDNEDYLHLDIPSVIEMDGTWYRITRIGEGAFSGCRNLGSVTIPDSVTSIGASAFRNCDELWSVTIPDSVTNIDALAFSNCYNLYSVTIPVSVTSIGWGAFNNCDLLIERENGIYYVGTWIIDSDESIKTVVFREGTIGIMESAFRGCQYLTSITIPDSVAHISGSAFDNCNKLTSITVSPDNAYYTSIDGNLYSKDASTLVRYASGKLDMAFSIPNDVTSIGDCAFIRCGNLTSIAIPDGVTSIGNSAFLDCSSLINITIPNGVTSIGNSAFRDCSSLTNIRIPDSVTSIYNYAFYNCSNLTSITVPNGVIVIGHYAFYNCSSLTNVKISDNVPFIGDYTFYGCSSLTSIAIPDGVTSIGEYAFRGCTGLTSITIPDSVTSIGSNAFYYCTNLTSITIGNGVTTIGDLAFATCYKLIEVYNLSNSITITAGGKDNGYVGYYALDVYTSADDASKLWKDANGYLFYEDGDTCYLIGYSGTATELILPINCNGKNYAIHKYAFYNYRGLRSITIPDGVTSIGNCAFQLCTSLTSITIPNSVMSIGVNAFSGCDKLIEVYNLSNSITITAGGKDNGNVGYYARDVYTSADDASKLWKDANGYLFYEDEDICYLMGYSGTATELILPTNCNGKNYAIYKYAFDDYRGLRSVTIPDAVTSIGNSAFGYCSSLMNIIIPDSVTSIGSYVFEGCTGLTSITIGNGVTTIGNGAFGYCSSLTIVKFEGIIEQWYAISKGSNWDKETGSYTIYCTDGNISKS